MRPRGPAAVRRAKEGTTVTGFDTGLVRKVTGWLVIAALCAGVIQIVRPFLVPLGWATVLSVFFHPLMRRVRRYVPRRGLAALVTVLLIALLIVIPVVALTPALISQSVAFLGTLTNGDLVARTRSLLEPYWARSPVPLDSLEEVLNDMARRATAAAAQASARLAGSLLRMLFDLAVMFLAMFYLLRDSDRILELVRDLFPWGQKRHEVMLREVSELVEVTISSGFLTATVQGILGGLLFWAVGISSPLFWGAFMGLMALLPVIGPWLVWGPAAVSLLMKGEVARGIILAVLGLVVVSGVDNVLRPALIAGRSQMNGLLVLVSVLGGIQAMGFLGVVVGPVLAATAVGLLKGYHESVTRERDAAQPPA